ncbi:uncharacterized protein [Epargyreus clarus]|uniref:uncharacterized protein isoform X2 n=1 Tax=Epargyreus clarus TaxID=520877 RepID=UPI003C2E8BF6
MDAAASLKKDAEIDKVYDFFLKIENSAFPASIKQRHSVIKYTKLPDVDYDSRVTWHEESYSLQPRLRRIVTINEPKLSSTRSLKPGIAIVPKMQNVTKRKIVTIEEDDENDLHPKFSREGKKPTAKLSNRAVGTEIREDKLLSQRTTSRLSPCSKYSKDIKLNSKTSLFNNKKDNDAAKVNYRTKNSEKPSAQNYLRSQKNKEKEVTRSTKSVYTTSKISVSKNVGTPNENEKDICLIKNKLSENWSNNVISKKMIQKQRISKSPPRQNRSKASFIKDIKGKNKAVTIIHVPLDDKYILKREKESEMPESILNATLEEVKKVDCSTEMENFLYSKDMNVGTDPLRTTVDQVTEIDTEFETICKCVKETNIHTELKETFDSLDIPNVTLIKDKTSNVPKENVVNFCSKSLPNVKIAMFDTNTKGHKKNDGTNDSRYSKSTSYIISRATLTYTTKQKINFHVLGTNDKIPNDVCDSSLAYPINVVSVFKKEVNNKDYENSQSNIERNKDKARNDSNNPYNMKLPYAPYIFDNSKLVKPSDILSNIGVHEGLLQNDFICEQFQRELNFIDSFFESLQYLEHCSLAEKCLSENKVESWINKSGFDLKKLEYGSLLSKYDNETHVDDSETMASKSLCLLNLLIRDEQRRAKNLLFVLKMREDALKDFTKSQILWLENKKKQVNTDISTLKKKQRGALLKLQHECGEMQRMRKALLTLSEKRKVALIKTKKNIELKFRNNIDVDQILSGKKKIKRNTISDRSLAPVKCFDLSSSGCDDSTTSWPRSETPVVTPDLPTNIDIISSAEKSIQTGDSVLVTSTVDQSTNTVNEHFVVVDGGYLNILFHNLSLPQIFSSDKQYEVNEEALKNIVNTANSNRCNLNEECDIEKIMDQIKNREVDMSTSPSTARSLVEEFDQYYRGLVEEVKLPVDSSQQTPVICEVRDTVIQATESRGVSMEQPIQMSSMKGHERTNEELRMLDSAIESHESYVCDPLPTSNELMSKEVIVASVAGPLPVPAGAAATSDTTIPDATTWLTHKPSTTSNSSDTNSSCPTMSSVSSIASPVHYEAEELRRQQLAIEREIKALEQQQCQLLVVREIPDKPPPPYTPPNDSRAPKLPKMFMLDDATEQKICKYMCDSTKNTFDSSEPFEVFVKDFCQETIKIQRSERSDKPWDSCNLLPQKPPDSAEKIVERTTTHLAEVLKGVTPTVVSGVGARRSDHIDDILFAEWRRCEPEWTALHSDEVIVKNQLFESIFQRVLTETVDEYKRTVLCVKNSSANE